MAITFRAETTQLTGSCGRGVRIRRRISLFCIAHRRLRRGWHVA